MDRKVYFGNANKQLWIPAPRTGLDASPEGYFSQSQLLSGRAFQKRSKANHRRFTPAWVGSLNSTDINNNLHVIKDFFDGIYGEGPLYWLDPFATDQNLLAPNWAAPMLSLNGWSSISSVGTQALVTTDANSNDYPYQSLEITFAGGVQASTIYQRIIIPEDFRLHFGWHGSRASGSATIILRCYPRDGGAAVNVTTNPIAVTSSVRTNAQVSGNTYSMVDIMVRNVGVSPSVIEIAGMIAQVRPDGELVTSGGFISGRGTLGLLFSSAPKISYLSSKINEGQVELATSFIEE